MPYGSEAPAWRFAKNFVHFIILYKMENMRVPELKALAREHGLRNYSWLRKAELIELIRNDQRPVQSWEPSMPQRTPNQPRPPHPNRPLPPPPTQTWEPIDDRLRPELEAPLTKKQLKHR